MDVVLLTKDVPLEVIFSREIVQKTVGEVVVFELTEDETVRLAALKIDWYEPYFKSADYDDSGKGIL